MLFRTVVRREEEAQVMGVDLKYSDLDNNGLWLTVYTSSFVSCSVPSGASLDNCSENYNTSAANLC